MTSLSALGQIALPVSDADRAEAFYAEKLRLSKLFRLGNLVFFDCGGVRLMLEGNSQDRNRRGTGDAEEWFEQAGLGKVKIERRTMFNDYLLASQAAVAGERALLWAGT